MSFELEQLPGHPLLAELAPEAMPRLGAQDIWVALPPRSLQVFETRDCFFLAVSQRPLKLTVLTPFPLLGRKS